PGAKGDYLPVYAYKRYWVRNGEAEHIQGCQKIERAGKKVIRRKENVLRRDSQNHKKTAEMGAISVEDAK
ncbi:hypothetical protein ACQWF6_25810, partial [Salmonella enterica subsp. enterica serovar Infantis]